MKRKILLLTIFASLFTITNALARLTTNDTTKIKKILPPIQKFYVGTAFDGAIFSTATIKEGAGSAAVNKTGILRFTYVINFGFTFNYNFGRYFGAYTGIDIKNIGFIEKNNAAEPVKRRTYNIGVPLGIKIGNMVAKRPYIFLGGGVDAPFNYREKVIVIRAQKTKFSEWFSERTPSIMPYVFAGAAINRGITFKVQYYPNNFLNPDYTTGNGLKPYAGYDVHLILFSIGLVVPLSKHHDIVKANVSSLHTM